MGNENLFAGAQTAGASAKSGKTRTGGNSRNKALLTVLGQGRVN